MEAHDQGLITDVLLPPQPGENDIEETEDQSTATREYVHDHGSKVVELARRHGFSEFDSGRAGNRIYEDEQIEDLFANACLTQGSAHSEGEASLFLASNDWLGLTAKCPLR